MSFRQIVSTHRIGGPFRRPLQINYLCVAADVKLTTVPDGSIAYETDTGDTFIFNGAAWVAFTAAGGGGGGTGDVVGPGSATDNALALFDSTTGKLIKNSTVKLVTTVFSPTVNDATALGSGSLGWSDLFLASGGVINWANGGMTITHASNLLTITNPTASTGVMTLKINPGAGQGTDDIFQVTSDGTNVRFAITGDKALLKTRGANLGNTPAAVDYDTVLIGQNLNISASNVGGIIRAAANSVFGFTSVADDSNGSASDTSWSRISAGLSGFGTGAQGSFAGSIKLTNIIGQAGYHEMVEMTAPGAGGADTVRLYADVSGAKTRLMAIFQSGAAVQIAIEP